MDSMVLNFNYISRESERLDLYLVNQLPNYSRAYLQNLIKKGNVKVNGVEILKTGFKLDQHCEVSIILPPPEPLDLVPEEIPLDLLFENEDVLVINKPAGMVVHPSSGHSTGTLVHGILAHSPNLAGIGGVKRPGIVHRLDKETSGVLIVAKNDIAHRFLQAEFKNRRVEKTYLALVDAKPPTPIGRVEVSIGRDATHRQRMAVVTQGKGRLAISEYKTLKTYAHHSLLQVNIHTGRTHQIRLHMAFLKCPVVGDRVYGLKTPSLPVNRHLLHALKLVINLPHETEKRIFEAPLPTDFENVLERLI